MSVTSPPQPSATPPLASIISTRALLILTAIAAALGVGTLVVTTYGNSQEAATKTEIAKNADALKAAEAHKAAADAKLAQALADNAKVRQAAEAKFAQQRAIVDQAVARYAERMKKAEADKLAAEATAAQEVAKNSEVKLQAEADAATLDALRTEHEANINVWLNNCAASLGGRSGDLVTCSTRWRCLNGGYFC